MNALSMDVIYTDFTKAFDRVDHSILLNVLRKSRFRDPLLARFLSDQLKIICLD